MGGKRRVRGRMMGIGWGRMREGGIGWIDTDI
jgi:hypothetical protein